ncbi:hypothetical protein HJG60_011705 [Phyllostomus discolor]|uniref:Uncharacterized protein n=1 Tax=Phyllostomus discolor TaxID=89673 RepID=A0A833ZW90_9CHIR|nr:hypothetical protein HJG60_011704 [Phyllostomus discolor]KAF6099989.1 hypothetical protein HJG60_011705 [Phyllostomus discolor]
MSENGVGIRTPGEQYAGDLPPRLTSSTEAPPLIVSLGTSMPSVTQVPLRGPIHSVVLFRATPNSTRPLSDQQEQAHWNVRQAPLPPRPPKPGTWARKVRQVRNWQAPDTTSLSPVAPSNIKDEYPDPSGQVAEDTHIYMTAHLPAINDSETEEPAKAATGAAEKTGRATEPRKGAETPRQVVSKDYVPVQDESRVSLANPTIETENLQNNISEILLEREQLTPKYAQPSQLLEKDTMVFELKELFEAEGPKSQAAVMVENLRRQAARRALAWVTTQHRQFSKVYIEQSPESQRLCVDSWAVRSSLPNILVNLKLKQKKEEGNPEFLVQGKPVLQPRPPKTPKPTCRSTKSTFIPPKI